MPGRDGGAQVAGLLEQGIARYAAGDLAEALRLFRDAAALGPDDVRARAYVAWTEWRSTTGAIEFAEREPTPVRQLVTLGSFTDDEDDATPVRSAAAVLAPPAPSPSPSPLPLPLPLDDEPSMGGDDEPTSVHDDEDVDEDEVTFSGDGEEEGEAAAGGAEHGSGRTQVFRTPSREAETGGAEHGSGRTQVFRTPSREAVATIEPSTVNTVPAVEVPVAAALAQEDAEEDEPSIEVMAEVVAEADELPPPPHVVELVAEPDVDAPEQPPAPAPPPPSPNTSHPSLRAQREILDQLTPLRQAIARRDPVAAWIEAERLMSRGLDLGALPGATELLSRVYRERLEPLGRLVLVAQHPAQLEQRAAFVVSQADGSLSIEDLIDISPIPRLDALRLLARLFDEGILYANERPQGG